MDARAAMEELERIRFEKDMEIMRNSIKEARLIADHAANSISTHEQICSIRYDTITRQLQDFPKIFAALNSLQKHVYIGVGLVIAMGALLRVIH